jgi:hypothetical protein
VRDLAIALFRLLGVLQHFHHRAALVFVGARDGAAALFAKVIAAVLWIAGIACSSVMRALRSGP